MKKTLQKTLFEMVPTASDKSSIFPVEGRQEKEHLRSFFEAISKKPYKNGVIDSFFSEIVSCLRSAGISEENLRAGMLLTVTLISARLGYPLVTILSSKDKTDAVELIEKCKKMVPSESYLEIQQLKTEHLYANDKYYSNKVLIIRDVKDFKKAMPDLMYLLTLGYAERQETYTSKLGDGTKNYKITYPIGFIGIEAPDGQKYPLHPSFIRVDLTNNDNSARMQGYEDMDTDYNKPLTSNSNIIKVLLERLSKAQVSIPYRRAYYDCMVNCQVKDIKTKMSIIDKAISICTILNHPPGWTMEELMQRVTSLEKAPIHSKGIYVATKADYYFVHLLLNDLIPIGRNHFSQAQKELFYALKKINYAKLQSAIISKLTDLKTLSVLYRNPVYWANIEEVFEEINEDKAIIMSYTDIEQQLNILNKSNIISKRKFKDKKSYGYFINMLNIENTISLPCPSDIEGTTYISNNIKVFEPILNRIKAI